MWSANLSSSLRYVNLDAGYVNAFTRNVSNSFKIAPNLLKNASDSYDCERDVGINRDDSSRAELRDVSSPREITVPFGDPSIYVAAPTAAETREGDPRPVPRDGNP